MAMTIAQVATATGAAVQIGVLLPGGSVTIQTTGANPNYVGLSSAVTSATGFPFLAGTSAIPVTWMLAATSAPVTLWAISVTGASTIAVATTTTV